MKTLILQRVLEAEWGTLGVIFESDTLKPVCLSLEHKWNNNLPDVSCIPPGHYHVKPFSSDDHPGVFELQNVPGRSDILTHIGNKISDTKGCIILGLGIANDIKTHNDPTPGTGVVNSSTALSALKNSVQNEDFYLIVQRIAYKVGVGDI